MKINLASLITIVRLDDNAKSNRQIKWKSDKLQIYESFKIIQIIINYLIILYIYSKLKQKTVNKT